MLDLYLKKLIELYAEKVKTKAVLESATTYDLAVAIDRHAKAKVAYFKAWYSQPSLDYQYVNHDDNICHWDESQKSFPFVYNGDVEGSLKEHFHSTNVVMLDTGLYLINDSCRILVEQEVKYPEEWPDETQKAFKNFINTLGGEHEELL